jgi:hypothetical protein
MLPTGHAEVSKKNVRAAHNLFPLMNGLTYLYALCSNIDQCPKRTRLWVICLPFIIVANVAAM